MVSIDTPVHTDELEDDAPTLGESLTSTDDTARTVEQRLELDELVARAGLSPREREVLLHRAEDRTDAEIAARLGITRGAVSSLWTRCRRKLIDAREKSRGDV